MMNIPKAYTRVIVVVLVAVMLQSCVIRRFYPAKKEALPQHKDKIFNLIWPEQQKSSFYLVECELTEGILSGSVRILDSLMVFPPKQQVVRLYLKDTVPPPEPNIVDYQLNIEDIHKLEIYDIDQGATLFVSSLVFAGLAAFVMAVVLVIIILTKESCPFVYSFDGTDYQLSGEIYSGAIFPSLERDDYLILPQLQPHEGAYKLRLANDIEEIQHTNLTILRAVDHPQGTELLVDKYGRYYTVSDPQTPISAKTPGGQNVLEMLKNKDQYRYSGDISADKTRPKDAVDISFSRPVNSDNARLLLRAKNSFWLDYTMGRFFDMFGNKYQSWYARQSAAGDQNPDWSGKQGIPLSVYLKRDGKWQYVDSYAIVGPIADRDIVMPLDLSGITGDKLEIRLECGAFFWDIDYAALDSTPQKQVKESILPLRSAIDNTGKDVRDILMADDDRYYTQNMGDHAYLEYDVPPLQTGMERTLILHSKGHYQKLRDPQGKPNIAKLSKFRQAGALGSFSRELFHTLKSAYVR